MLLISQDLLKAEFQAPIYGKDLRNKSVCRPDSIILPRPAGINQQRFLEPVPEELPLKALSKVRIIPAVSSDQGMC